MHKLLVPRERRFLPLYFLRGRRRLKGPALFLSRGLKTGSAAVSPVIPPTIKGCIRRPSAGRRRFIIRLQRMIDAMIEASGLLSGKVRCGISSLRHFGSSRE